MKGLYSLIQWCPDHSRMEAVNVGIALFCHGAHPWLGVKMSLNNDRVERFFGQDDYDLSRVADHKKAIETKMLMNIFTYKELYSFVASRANDIILTPPRSIKINYPATDLISLFEELVL